MSKKQEIEQKANTNADTVLLGETLALRINNPLPMKDADKQLFLFENMKDFETQQKKKDQEFSVEEADYAFGLLVKGGMSKMEAYQKTHPNSKTKNKNTLYVAASRLYNSAKMELIFSYIDDQMKLAAGVSVEEITYRLRKELESSDANVRLRAIRYLGEGIGYFKTVHEGKLNVARDASVSELDEFLGRHAKGKAHSSDTKSGKK
ncbi:hypothetical protein Dip510_000838 [Elusimicrobium posterum]|uniref:hypothetical protein n=1 Tax=Elusimicrobium posterum TaxID=3116653 RepID=UPI003C73EACF